MTKRCFLLGEEWVFLKIYLGSGTADLLISDQLGPFAASLVEEGIVSKWFFIRYHDAQGFHLRIRFEMVRRHFLQDILFRIRDLLCPLIQQRLVHTVMYDTYRRELERYGTISYDLIEEYFYEDSRCVSKILSLINQSDNPSLRWKSAITMINDTLDAYGMTIEEKKRFIVSNRDSFREEFNVNTSSQTRVFDKKYRESRKYVIDASKHQGFPQEMNQIMEERKRAITGIFIGIQTENSPVNISSLLHMTCNRLFAGFSRQCELTLYEYLSRHYASMQAQEKYCKQ